MKNEERILDTILKKYLGEFKQENISIPERNLKKTAEVLNSVLMKHGLTDLEKLIVYTTGAETISELLIKKFNKLEGKEDLKSIFWHIHKINKENSILRTKIISLINLFYEKPIKEFDLGKEFTSSATSKRRFEILKRDNFTCVYCGRKPPEVCLEVDHSKSKKEDGDNSKDNLVTACRDCNRGKARDSVRLYELKKEKKDNEEVYKEG